MPDNKELSDDIVTGAEIGARLLSLKIIDRMEKQGSLLEAFEIDVLLNETITETKTKEKILTSFVNINSNHA